MVEMLKEDIPSGNLIDNIKKVKSANKIGVKDSYEFIYGEIKAEPASKPSNGGGDDEGGCCTN